MANKAWVTLATNDTYALGALVLAHSLKKVNTAYKLVVLVASNVTFAMRGSLQSVYDEVKEVDVLDSEDAENLRLLARPELGITFTKLHSWKLTQYEKCVFLDADTLVLQNCDELFEREELSAAPDVGWPDCFNSGVFVFKPSEETFKALYEFAIAHGSFDGGDQGLLNMFFNTWATSDASKRLPFLYNLSSAAIYSYLPAFKWFGKGVKIIHFISNSKPWLQSFNSSTRTVESAPGSSHLQNFLQYWWDLFCAFVYPQLSPEMTRLLLRSWYTPKITLKTNPSRIIPTYNEVSIPDTFVTPDEEPFVFTDPWEEFEKNVANSAETYSHIPNTSVCVTECSFNENETFNDNVYDACEDPLESDYFEYDPAEPVNLISNEVYDPPLELDDSHNDYSNEQSCETEQINCSYELDEIVSQIVQHSCDLPMNNFSSLHSLKSEILREENNCSDNKSETNNDNAGLANSLSQMKLEEPTPEQIAREDFFRRQNWEHGNIDYMGKDSFNNIWEKIAQTMNDSEDKPQEKLPEPFLAICPAKPADKSEPATVVPEPEPVSPTPKPVEPTAAPSQPAQPVAPAAQPEPVSCPKPESTPSKPESVAAPEPVVCPKPESAPKPEPVAAPQPLVCPKPKSAPQPEPVAAPQPLVCPKSESAPPKPEPVAAPQPPVCPKPESASKPEIASPKESQASPVPQLISCPKPAAPQPAASVPAPAEPAKSSEDPKSKQTPKSGASKKK